MTATSIALAVPAKIVRVSGTTLFHVAERELGDATLWEVIADLNGLIDPWINAERALRIPARQQAVRRG